MIKKGFQLVTIGSDQRYMTAASKAALSKLKKDQNKDSGKVLLNTLMSYFVYMLKSKNSKPVTYVGYTNNIKKRITYIMRVRELNLQKGENGNLFIKKIKTKNEAISREYYIKNNRSLRKS